MYPASEHKEKLSEILKAVEYAFAQFKNSFKRGKNSEELLKPFLNGLAEKLGEYEILYDYLLGKDSLNVDGVTKNYIPKTNDTIIMDISVGKDGVWCDICRTFFVEKFSKEQEQIYQMIRESIKKGEMALKANTTAQEIYKAVNSVYEENGKKLVHHAGHKIGAQALMQPQFLLEREEKIKQNEFYTIESGYYKNFGIRLENDYVINSEGCENLFEPIMSLDIKEYVLNEK